jgi:hypothetical protein
MKRILIALLVLIMALSALVPDAFSQRRRYRRVVHRYYYIRPYRVRRYRMHYYRVRRRRHRRHVELLGRPPRRYPRRRLRLQALSQMRGVVEFVEVSQC